MAKICWIFRWRSAENVKFSINISVEFLLVEQQQRISSPLIVSKNCSSIGSISLLMFGIWNMKWNRINITSKVCNVKAGHKNPVLQHNTTEHNARFAIFHRISWSDVIGKIYDFFLSLSIALHRIQKHTQRQTDAHHMHTWNDVFVLVQCIYIDVTWPNNEFKVPKHESKQKQWCFTRTPFVAVTVAVRRCRRQLKRNACVTEAQTYTHAYTRALQRLAIVYVRFNANLLLQ